PVGWSSPSVYPNGDTMPAVAAEGITYTIDQMDSDIISRLKTPDGSLIQLPYPVVTVDMGQHLARMKMPAELETLWLDYVLELAGEARADPAREATTVVIGIHPFVIGTPDGAAVLRRVLSRLKKDDQVWLTDTDAILKGGRPEMMALAAARREVKSTAHGAHRLLFTRGEARASDGRGVFDRVRVEQLAESIAWQIARLDVEARGDGLVFGVRRCFCACFLKRSQRQPPASCRHWNRRSDSTTPPARRPLHP